MGQQRVAAARALAEKIFEQEHPKVPRAAGTAPALG
jgi:hypothetical protein